MDLLFAIDDLYSAGWWPIEGDTCARASDGRWYPDRAGVGRAIERAGRRLAVHPCASGHAARAQVFEGHRVCCTVTAGDGEAACLLALAELTRHLPMEAARRAPDGAG